jgi:hypothetical protein
VNLDCIFMMKIDGKVTEAFSQKITVSLLFKGKVSSSRCWNL